MWNYNDVRLFLATVHYEHPHLIWWAIPAAALTAVLFFVWWRARVKAIKLHGDLSLVTRFTRLPGLGIGSVIGLGLVLAVVLGAVSATMPYQTLRAISVPSGSLHVVAVFDTSKSVGAEDNRSDRTLFGGSSCALTDGPCGSRIDIAKLILMNQIMPTIKDNQLALVVYSGNAVTRSFLTDDFDPIKEMLTTWHWVDVGSALGEGSYVDQGLTTAVEVLNHDKPKAGQPPAQNVILLFTDGGNDSKPEDLEKAKEAVKEAHAKLLIVGLGADKESPIPLYDGEDKPLYNEHGQRSYFPIEEGQTTARNDGAMEQLASDVQGQYLKVVPGQPLVVNWPTTLAGTKVVIAKRYLYPIPLAGTVAILGLIWLSALWSRLLALLNFSAKRALGRRS